MIYFGQRIKEERNRQGLTQEALITNAGLDWDRQILGQVETGVRDLKAWELSKIANALSLSLASFFPQENQVTSQPVVLWREKPANHKQLEADFIRMCKDYRFIENLNLINVEGLRKLPRKYIDLENFKHSEAYALAEEIRSDMDLGNYPATGLIKVLEERYGVKFFFNELDGNGSAAASVSEYGLCVLISSSEPAWRQHFSLAHELFHIITWSKKLLNQVSSNQKLWDHNESLANSFAAGLLVPTEALHHEIRQLQKLNDAGIVSIARQFGVSLDALLWRMANLSIIKKETAQKALKNDQMKLLDRQSLVGVQVPRYLSNRFIRLAYVAYENGEISRGCLAKVLNKPLADLSEFLNQFGLSEVGNNEIPLSHA
jgi:Zn-dependent peptidase ImmA (M78 family)/DNA-binding XRE family transcriptional regulator